MWYMAVYILVQFANKGFNFNFKYNMLAKITGSKHSNVYPVHYPVRLPEKVLIPNYDIAVAAKLHSLDVVTSI
jgi:hypothetical protein